MVYKPGRLFFISGNIIFEGKLSATPYKRAQRDSEAHELKHDYFQDEMLAM
jgi:hypothetical protein